MSKTQCPRCLAEFSRPQRLVSHLNRKKKCPNVSEIKAPISASSPVPTAPSTSETNSICEFKCIHCESIFTRKFNLERHQQKYCQMAKIRKSSPNVSPNVSPNTSQKPEMDSHKRIDDLNDKIRQLEEKLEAKYTELKEMPKQIVQVVCVGGNQNYLDMLTDQMGDYNQALSFIKDCALSNLSGDCKLLQKIYFDRGQPSMNFLDNTRNRVEYMDDKREKVVDYNGQKLGKILAGNLQNSYLKGVNYLINQSLTDQMIAEKFLDEHDVQSWNNHIYELSDHTYQKKMISSLNLPVKNQAGS